MADDESQGDSGGNGYLEHPSCTQFSDGLSKESSAHPKSRI